MDVHFLPTIDSDTPAADTRIHFVGIGGSGMSSLATVLLDAGRQVSGSDLNRSAVVQELERRGARIAIGHDPSLVDAATLVVRSSAVPDTDPEVARAVELKRPVLKRAQVLGAMSAERRTLCVAGTHGKTTTSAMLATIFEYAGRDPTVLVGGVIPSLKSGAKLGHGEFLIAEADEFDRSFLTLHPEVAIVTNVEPDHLDYFGDFGAIKDAFKQFLILSRKMAGLSSAPTARRRPLSPTRTLRRPLLTD